MKALPPEPTGPSISPSGLVSIYLPTPRHPYWRFSFYEAGKRKQPSGGSTWEECYAELEKIEARLVAGLDDKPTRPASQWLDWWVSEDRVVTTSRGIQTTSWGPKHRLAVLAHVDAYIRPAVGTLTCEQLRTRDLQRAIDAAARASTPDVARRVRLRICTAVREGFRDGWFVLTPEHLTGRLVLPPSPVQPRQAGEAHARISDEEVPDSDSIAAVARACAHVGAPKWWCELMPQLAAVTGLRLGEILNLDVSDIDLEQRIVRVTTQALEVGGAPRCALPKGAKTRTTVFLPTGPGGYDLTEALARRMEEVNSLPEFRCCERHGPRHLLFGAPRTHRWWPQSRYARDVWTPARRAAGWRQNEGGHRRFQWSFHSLRHYFVTTMVNAGASLPDISAAVGHASEAFTMQRYVGTQRGAIDRLRQVNPLGEKP